MTGGAGQVDTVKREYDGVLIVFEFAGFENINRLTVQVNSFKVDAWGGHFFLKTG